MKVITAKILQGSVSSSTKDTVVRLGLHIADGDDVFIDCNDIEERGVEIDDTEVKAIIDKATAEGCDYIHLY